MSVASVQQLLQIADELRERSEDLETMAEYLGRDVAASWSFPVGSEEYPAEAWYAATWHDESGEKNGGYGHTGVDLNVDRWPRGDIDRGQPVFAVADGVIKAVGYSANYLGSVVMEVEHAGALLYVRYWHLIEDDVFRSLQEWQTVRGGDCIGHIGNYQLGAGWAALVVYAASGCAVD
jgi:murein DD-endopeptidase MepM/ murein hydrolase activator NlpD